jgi:tRNA (guanine10-N2)-methyltransferase
MANMAQVAPGRVVLDPFVGTGSILVAAAHFGGFCFGTDIDIRVLHGIGKGGKNVFSNFDQVIFIRARLS